MTYKGRVPLTVLCVRHLNVHQLKPSFNRRKMKKHYSEGCTNACVKSDHYQFKLWLGIFSMIIGRFLLLTYRGRVPVVVVLCV